MVDPSQANGVSPLSPLAPYYSGSLYYGFFHYGSSYYSSSYYGSFLIERQPMKISLSALVEQRFEQLYLRRLGNQIAQHTVSSKEIIRFSMCLKRFGIRVLLHDNVKLWVGLAAI